MAFKYDDIDADLRGSIERGVFAIRRINSHENFDNWLAVGQACLDMQTAAMRLAHTNQPKGRGYNDAFKMIAHEVPDLAALNPTTRSHAVWMADPSRRQAIVEWHQRLATNIRQEVNHPTTVWRRYQRDTAAPAGETDAAAKPVTPIQKANVEIARLQEELDAANTKIRRMERSEGDMLLISRKDTPEAIIAVLESEIPTKAARIASILLARQKSTAPTRKSGAAKAPRRQPPAERQWEV